MAMIYIAAPLCGAHMAQRFVFNQKSKIDAPFVSLPLNPFCFPIKLLSCPANPSAFADEAGSSCEEQIAALQRAGLDMIDVRSLDGFNVSALPLDVRNRRKKIQRCRNFRSNVWLANRQD